MALGPDPPPLPDTGLAAGPGDHHELSPRAGPRRHRRVGERLKGPSAALEPADHPTIQAVSWQASAPAITTLATDRLFTTFDTDDDAVKYLRGR